MTTTTSTQLTDAELSDIRGHARRWYMVDAGILAEDVRHLLTAYTALSEQLVEERAKSAELRQYRIDHPAFGYERCEHDVLLTEDCSQCPDPDAEDEMSGESRSEGGK